MKIDKNFRKDVTIMIILKVTKKQSFTLSLEDTFLEKPQGFLGLNKLNVVRATKLLFCNCKYNSFM